MAQGWEGEKVRLVPLDRERHVANAVAWINDPAVTAWTLVGDTPLTRLAEEEYFDRACRGTESEVHFAVETLEGGEHIGFTALVKIDWRQGVASSGTILGRRDLWGRGYGSEVARLRTRYAFDVLGLRLLLTEVMAGNEASRRALEKAGYRQVGRIPRRYWKRGAFHDALILVAEREPPAG